MLIVTIHTQPHCERLPSTSRIQPGSNVPCLSILLLVWEIRSQPPGDSIEPRLSSIPEWIQTATPNYHHQQERHHHCRCCRAYSWIGWQSRRHISYQPCTPTPSCVHNRSPILGCAVEWHGWQRRMGYLWPCHIPWEGCGWKLRTNTLHGLRSSIPGNGAWDDGFVWTCEHWR